MTRARSLTLALLLVGVPWLALPSSGEAQHQRYHQVKTRYEAERGKQLASRLAAKNQRFDQRTQRRITQARPVETKPAIDAPAVTPVVTTPPRSTLADSTLRTYVSRALHQQAGMNYFLSGSKLRVTGVTVDPNRISYANGLRYLAWSAQVKGKDGSYQARGFIQLDLDGKVKGLDRVKIQSGTPVPTVISR